MDCRLDPSMWFRSLPGMELWPGQSRVGLEAGSGLQLRRQCGCGGKCFYRSLSREESARVLVAVCVP